MTPDEFKAREEELIHSIEGSFSSPEMDEFAHLLRRKDWAGADKFLKEEGIKRRMDRRILIDRCVRDFAAKNMKVVEVAPKDVPVVSWKEWEKSEKYLVRVGTKVFISRAVHYRDEEPGVVTFLDDQHNQWTADEVDQIMQIVLEK
jgi:hypothetical protein